jgi:hypothetical protein|tara:strand:+ start:327 stop:446 length:120 start_codon:yes stop_codon:yes gene_type:complete
MNVQLLEEYYGYGIDNYQFGGISGEHFIDNIQIIMTLED